MSAQFSRAINLIIGICVLSILMILGSSCVREISLSEETFKKKIAVSCVLTNKPIQKLSLTWNSNKLNKGFFFEDVKTAKISLFQEDKYIGDFKKTSYGEWTLEHFPEANKQYRLVVEIPDHPTIEATTIMPANGKIQFLGLQNRGELKYFKEPKDLTNPYWCFALTSTLEDFMYAVNLPKLEDDPNPKLRDIIHTNHSRADLFNQDSRLFSASGMTDQRMLPFRYYIRIDPSSEKELPSNTFCVNHRWSMASFVVFWHCSTEFDQYIKSVMQKRSYYTSLNAAQVLFDDVDIYCNIKNGLGIFAAYYEEYFYCHNIIMDKQL